MKIEIIIGEDNAYLTQPPCISNVICDLLLHKYYLK